MAPRDVRTTDALGIEATSEEVVDAMRIYAEAHQVDEMLQYLLTKLLQSQPLDPYTFLLEALTKDPALLALEAKAKAKRFDLRRTKSQRRIIEECFDFLWNLQQQHLAGKSDAYGLVTTVSSDANHEKLLSVAFALEQMQQNDMRKRFMQWFPRHYRDILLLFRAKGPIRFDETIAKSVFTAELLQLLSGISQAS